MKNDIYNQPKSVLDAINEILANEGKSSTGYELYHRDFSSAMKHAYDFAKKKFGIEIDPSEIDDKVATGPRKPSSGKTNRYRLMGKDKNGKTKGVQIQVANLDNKKYELNMYKEEIELDEARWEYKGNTNYKVGGNLRYDDKLDYKLSKADADILNKYMKQAKNDAARSKVWNMFWDSKETGDKAKGPEKAIAFAKKAIKEEVELEEKVNVKAIQKAVDDGKSMDVIMTMFANKRTTNTDEIRKVVRDYKWKKRMKREEVELEEKVEYVEYKFRNKNDAMKAKAMLDATNLMSFEINDDDITNGELAVDAGNKDMTKFHKEIMKKFRPKVLTQESLEEKFSPKEIKMAIGIASDPRYKQGNYSGAVKQIEKIKKGLSTHKQVAAVLKRQNEELDISLEEGKMSPDQIEKLKKGYESLRGKKISAEMGMKISRELEKLDKNAAMQIAKADIPFVSTLAINKLMMNFNMSGSAIRKLIGESVEELVEEIEGLKKKSEKSGIAYGILKKVYDRGMAAWKSGHRPGTTPQQWAFARVNSFITGGGARKADNDLWSKHKGKSPKKEGTTMKRFGTFMNEATGGMKMIGAASELEKYSKKSGGIDKKDFMKAVKLMRQGMTDKLVDFTMDLDTEPREKIVDIVANHIGVKATEKMFKVRFNNRSEEVKLDEGKMKDLAIDVDNVYKGMMKNKMMKAFADKFKKDVSKSMNIRKSLEKILPDYVPGKDIQSLMASHCKDLNASHCMSEEKIKCPECDGKGCDHCDNKGYHMKDEELSPKQKKIDLNKNGKVDGDDLAKLRKKKNEDMGFELCDTCETPKECMAEETCLAGPVDESVSIDFAELIENSDKKDAKEMADVIKELDPKVKSKELKQKVYDMAMEKYKNKTRATKIANMIK